LTVVLIILFKLKLKMQILNNACGNDIRRSYYYKSFFFEKKQ